MPDKIEPNGVVAGRVIKIKPFGAIVQLPDKSQGLVHISHISNMYVQDINDFISVGDVVNVKVLSVEAASGKISLSIKDAEQDETPRKPEPREDYGYARQTEQNPQTFEEKFKEWVKSSNERHAGINKRNKRR